MSIGVFVSQFDHMKKTFKLNSDVIFIVSFIVSFVERIGGTPYVILYILAVPIIIDTHHVHVHLYN